MPFNAIQRSAFNVSVFCTNSVSHFRHSINRFAFLGRSLFSLQVYYEGLSICNANYLITQSTDSVPFYALRRFKRHCLPLLNGPRQANLVLIAYASSEGSASLRIRVVSPEPPLLAHTSSESRGTFRQKARSLAPLNGWACAVKICHDGMLEDTNSLDGAHMMHITLV